MKNAPTIKPAFSRGFVNNGYVEIDDGYSGDESGWKDFPMFGRMVQLPVTGIAQDFLSRYDMQSF